MWPFGAKVEDSFQKTVEIEGPVKLEVETASGDITVSRGNEGQVYISAKFQVQAASEEEARKLAQKIKEDPPIKQVGNTIKVGDLRKYGFKSWFWGPSIVIDFDIKTPQNTAVELDSGSGDQKVSGIKGPVKAAAGSGDIEITDIEAGVEVDTGSGNIRASNIGGDIEADAGSGDVNLNNISGDVNVDVGSGDVILKDVRGNMEVDAGSGDITVDSKIGDGLGWEFDTGSGDVKLTLPKDSSFAIRAETSSGEIDIDFPVTVSGRVRKELVGQVGEKPTSQIKIETSSGDIKIKIKAK